MVFVTYWSSTVTTVSRSRSPTSRSCSLRHLAILVEREHKVKVHAERLNLLLIKSGISSRRSRFQSLPRPRLLKLCANSKHS